MVNALPAFSFKAYRYRKRLAIIVGLSAVIVIPRIDTAHIYNSGIVIVIDSAN